MDVSWPIAGSWALAACCALAILAWWLARRDKRTAALRKELRAALREEGKARGAYFDLVKDGTAEEAVRAAAAVTEARKRVEAIRRQLGTTLFAVLACALATAQGCKTVPPTERIVRLDAHLRIVDPGETVPDYPQGETRWWLATPTGIQSLVPQFPLQPGEGVDDE